MTSRSTQIHLSEKALKIFQFLEGVWKTLIKFWDLDDEGIQNKGRLQWSLRLIRYGHIRFRNFLFKVLETCWQRGLKTVRLSIAGKGWNGHRQQVIHFIHKSAKAKICSESTLELRSLSSPGQPTLLSTTESPFCKQDLPHSRVSQNSFVQEIAFWRCLGLRVWSMCLSL